jgi:hypothetical protein
VPVVKLPLCRGQLFKVTNLHGEAFGSGLSAQFIISLTSAKHHLLEEATSASRPAREGI